MDGEERRLIAEYQDAADESLALTEEMECNRQSMEPAEHSVACIGIKQARERLEAARLALHMYRDSKP